MTTPARICAELESFVRGVPLWRCFFVKYFSSMSGGRIQIPIMAFRWRADDGPTLNAVLVALWSGPLLLRNPTFRSCKCSYHVLFHHEHGRSLLEFFHGLYVEHVEGGRKLFRSPERLLLTPLTNNPIFINAILECYRCVSAILSLKWGNCQFRHKSFGLKYLFNKFSGSFEFKARKISAQIKTLQFE